MLPLQNMRPRDRRVQRVMASGKDPSWLTYHRRARAKQARDLRAWWASHCADGAGLGGRVVELNGLCAKTYDLLDTG